MFNNKIETILFKIDKNKLKNYLKILKIKKLFKIIK